MLYNIERERENGDDENAPPFFRDTSFINENYQGKIFAFIVLKMAAKNLFNH